MGDFSYTHENDAVEFRDNFGGRMGFALNHDAAITYSVNGTVSSKAAGVNIAAFTAAATLANEDFMASAGSTYNTINYASADTILTGVSGNQPQGGGRTVTLEYLRPQGFSI